MEKEYLERCLFKVVDIYQVEDKTQVLLLNIPGHALQVFRSMRFPLEIDLVQKAREDFDTRLRSEPLSVLQEPEVLDRTAFPIGMSDEGEFFSIP